MNNKPFFSIVVVALNAEGLIGQTMESILRQSYHDYEVVVKDGMSEDATMSLVPDMPYIKKYVCPDSSIYDAMNQAIEHTAGKYIIFMNCGDEFASSDVLDKVYDQMKNEMVGLAYGNYIRGDIVHKQPSHLTSFYLYRTPLCHQSVFFNGETLRVSKRYNTNYKILADYNLELQLMQTEKCMYIPVNVCRYLGGGVSESEAGIIKKKAERRDILLNHYSFIKRLWFAMRLTMSLPGLRQKIAMSDNAVIRRCYQKIVNILNG